MSKYPRDNRPNLPRITRLELSQSNTKLRLILIVVFLVIGVTAFAYGISSVLSTQPGWKTIQASPTQPSYADDFVLQYDFAAGKGNPTLVEKQLASVYTEGLETAYCIFSPDVEGDTLGVAYLNAHVGQMVTVEPLLYEALTLVERYGNRHVFTAPAAGLYGSLFLCTNDAEAALTDPELDPDTAVWLAELSGFVSDTSAVWLELHGNNQVTLHVSDAYQSFILEHGITTVMDFGWMRNAFVADYLARELEKAGLTDGFLASYDGFTRNLDQRGQNYSQNLFDRQNQDIYMPAYLHYAKPMSIVALRDYPMSDHDRWHYYAYDSGRIVTDFLDPTTCKSRAALDTLFSYSTELGCAEILLEIAPVFTAETFESAVLLGHNAIHFVWFEDQTLCHTDPEAKLELLEDQIPYTIQQVS